MCLNQLLQDEQIALMRYSAATDPTEIDRYGRTIETIGLCLGSFPYRHRPYFPRNATGRLIAFSHLRPSADLSIRNNQAGAV
ncbi:MULTISPECIES: hypothetical protein [Novosphingobium]|uniref:Uncharacterized protein n=2 Tax=Alphaproteobacteria TaxID=28211 RepID=G6EGS6_9SPHN|nr:MULTISPECIES: hypothetical protein [Novosphingobium]AIT82076.1 hypothetical protein JI59_21285 [Novosphingobium pentaromativorans US6-1]EHJ59519.1 hypothetical protein NSU_3547 [Novosphingobium pentaromativorans US6-1]BBA74230.1 hypothetical protein [Ochrobactrum sp. PW1]GFM29079.1 uncharacterized protein PY1_contig-07-5 [Novosphingobium sp. PY1]